MEMAEANRSKRQRVYVEGNTVRKEAQHVSPQREQRQRQKTQKRPNKNIRRNQKKALYVDLPYVAVLTAASIAALAICVNYIQVQSNITALLQQTENLEQQIEDYQINNDAIRTRIHTYVDLDHVFQVATEELGMVYAGKSQVLQYHKTESEYVRQDEDIPEH